MKLMFCFAGTIALLLFGACASNTKLSDSDSNKKLSQDNAEKAIKTFASTNSADSILNVGWSGKCSFNVQSIAKIEQVSQFSDNEATSVMALKCPYDSLGRPFTLNLQFVFKKDVENRWFLTKIDNVVRDRWGSDYAPSEWVAKNQNLRVPVQ